MFISVQKSGLFWGSSSQQADIILYIVGGQASGASILSPFSTWAATSSTGCMGRFKSTLCYITEMCFCLHLCSISSLVYTTSTVQLTLLNQSYTASFSSIYLQFLGRAHDHRSRSPIVEHQSSTRLTYWKKSAWADK